MPACQRLLTCSRAKQFLQGGMVMYAVAPRVPSPRSAQSATALTSAWTSEASGVKSGVLMAWEMIREVAVQVVPAVPSGWLVGRAGRWVKSASEDCFGFSVTSAGAGSWIPATASGWHWLPLCEFSSCPDVRFSDGAEAAFA